MICLRWSRKNERGYFIKKLYSEKVDENVIKTLAGHEKAFTIKHAIDIGKKEYNFLRGTERYKYQLGAKDRSVFDLVIHR